MTRLTNAIRDAIKEKLLVRAFTDKVKDQIDREVVFVNNVYTLVFGDVLEAVYALPANWFDHSTYFSTEIAGQHVQLYFGSGFGQSRIAGLGFAQAASKRVPYQSAWRCAGSFPASSKVDKDYTALKTAHDDLEREIRVAAGNARAVLSSVSSVKSLIKVWPEIEIFAKPYLQEAAQQAALPVVQFDALNQVLGLPPETKAA